MKLAPVTVGHRDQLLAFSCATKGLDFTLEVELLIRQDLPDQLDAEVVQALGSWDDDRLAAIVVFKRNSSIWMIDLLATDIDYRNRKQAYRLKRRVLDLARADGARAVSSYVHRDNLRMRHINKRMFGVETDPDPSNPHILVTIPV